MNKLLKIIVSLIGGVDLVFSMYIPIAIALISINYFGFNGLWGWVLLLTGIISTIFRAVNVAFIRGN